ncbi:molecular chaperone DnaJ [Candidatus Parcubacteria bacterium]|nr:molecular chaperone DnaJ [Patescibacteria group bacterium]MCG2686566.1 molecular chaperone DnaJ [Candidatus Parcubacteria bacterium]
MPKDYYSTLGVDKKASQEEIKKAFRKRAHEYHPDKSSGDEAKFKEINEAYQTLGNKEKRSQYDQFGATFDSSGMGGNRGGFGGGQGFNWQDFARQYSGQQTGGFRTNINFDDFDLGDIVGDVFGFGSSRSRGRSRNYAQAGEDIQIQMTIDFNEAVFGAEKIIILDKQDVCDKCAGKGYEAKTKIITCPQCNGSGQIQQTQRTIFGAFSTATICPTCKGEGKKPESFCSKCRGQGRIKTRKELKISIPAGINIGETIKISKQGNSGSKGGQAGDLYISFNIQSNKEFVREEYNILSKAEINISQAALGDKIEINTLDGLVNLKIPAGTQSGKIFLLKNKGVPILNSYGRRGDQQVEVTVKIPTRLSRKQKKLLEELKDEM